MRANKDSNEAGRDSIRPPALPINRLKALELYLINEGRKVTYDWEHYN